MNQISKESSRISTLISDANLLKKKEKKKKGGGGGKKKREMSKFAI